ncbi:MAG: hypothetical protein FWD61_19805 [Phycisphaerales bacterium]|nr:hypothetical protein [Phycisphaerales bacterium]
MTMLSNPRVFLQDQSTSALLDDVDIVDMTQDSVIGDSIESRISCMYLFTGGNPINRVDPLGLATTQPTTAPATQPATTQASQVFYVTHGGKKLLTVEPIISPLSKENEVKIALKVSMLLLTKSYIDDWNMAFSGYDNSETTVKVGNEQVTMKYPNLYELFTNGYSGQGASNDIAAFILRDIRHTANGDVDVTKNNPLVTKTWYANGTEAPKTYDGNKLVTTVTSAPLTVKLDVCKGTFHLFLYYIHDSHFLQQIDMNWELSQNGKFTYSLAQGSLGKDDMRFNE